MGTEKIENFPSNANIQDVSTVYSVRHACMTDVSATVTTTCQRLEKKNNYIIYHYQHQERYAQNKK